MRNNKIWSWLPFIVILVTEEILAKFNKKYRLATENVGTTSLTEPGHYIVYVHDRPAGTSDMNLCRFATIQDNEITFLAPNREDGGDKEGTLTMVYPTAEDLVKATVPADILLKFGMDKVVNKLAVDGLYPGVNEDGTFNNALRAALREFTVARPLGNGTMGVAKLDKQLRYMNNGMPVALTSNNLRDFLVKQCPGSLLTKTLYGKAVIELPEDKKGRGANKNSRQQDETPQSVFKTPDWSTFA